MAAVDDWLVRGEGVLCTVLHYLRGGEGGHVHGLVVGKLRALLVTKTAKVYFATYGTGSRCKTMILKSWWAEQLRYLTFDFFWLMRRKERFIAHPRPSTFYNLRLGGRGGKGWR